MKKFKFLILILYLTLMNIGVGYAYWSDSLTINNTVSTGELSVRFEEGKADSLNFPEVKNSKYISNSEVKIGNDNNVLTDNNVATVNIANMYPGSFAAFRLGAINTGTIPVKISDVTFGEFSGDIGEKGLLNYLTFEAGFGIDLDGDKKIDRHIAFSGDLEEIQSSFNRALESKSLENTQINPGGGIYFYIPEGEEAPDLDKDDISDRFIIIKFSENAPDSTQNKKLTFKMTVNFKQFNKK
ncbi:SipW-dependent-type signal peptide-containing protein [Clostridium sp.]|uniref:SipW-dependent-type signal peptide-containing protein n=1 Tax=Clostridium sp. TaxID=1506 RepID=UPI001A3DF654|nr:SipW-dependent-type signal peptide-containing protein [Clostridium sp.]MBK5240637.1 hypothetical protein [Clostridium sp.]